MPDDVSLFDDDLRRRLVDLGDRVAFPPTPTLAPGVRRRIALDAPSMPPRGWRRFGSGRVVVPLAAGLLMVLVLLAALLLPLGATIADRLGVPGIGIVFLDETPTVEPGPVGGGLRLGRPIGLAKAQVEVDFVVRLPTAGPLGEPDDVYLAERAAEGMVSFVYRPRQGLPESSVPGIGALLTQFRGRIDEPLAYKGVSPGGVVEAVAVGDGAGYWIEGEAHLFLYREPEGEIRYEEYRLAGNVLLWEADGLTLRLESALEREAAIAIGASLSPVAQPEPGTDDG